MTDAAARPSFAAVMSLIPPHILARIRSVPTRLFAAVFTFGFMLALPGLLACVGAVLLAVGASVVGMIALAFSGVVFFGAVLVIWVLIFGARTRLKRAEAALYSGDFDSATRDAHFVVRTVFRSDYQMGALFTLAASAERLGAFTEAGVLFGRALAMMPAMAAQRPRRRASALLSAHAALDFAAAGDLTRASDMLARCQRELGAAGQAGALEALLDDSYMGAIGLNTMLVELESRRDPRPLAVLAWLVTSIKAGQANEVLSAVAHERAALTYGLAPHEQALAARVEVEAMRLSSGAGPMRSAAQGVGGTWEEMVLGA